MPDVTAETPAAAAAGKPTKPDQDEFEAGVKKLQAAHDAKMEAYNAIRAKIDLAMPNKSKETTSPQQLRRQELISEANEIRQKQAGGKNARTSKMDQIKRLDEQLRNRVQEQKLAKAKIPYKNLEELDHKIEGLEADVNSGKMKIVDEKKALNEISMLKKSRKNFGQFDEQQKQIDDLRAKIKEIKDNMDDPEQKAMSERYTEIQTELDAIKAESDEAFKNISSLRDERSRLQKEQQESFSAIKALKDDYYSRKKAWQSYEREAREKAAERRRLERERAIKDRKRAEAERLLAEASDPAYLEEIRRANSLLKFLDPTYDAGDKGPLQANSGLGATALRKVEDIEIKGTKLVRKEDRDDDYLPAVKKGKKGKKREPTTAAAPESTKFSCPPSVMADCASMGIDPPMSAADVPGVIEKVRGKLEHWKTDQAIQTQKNIEKAKREIERLEKEDGANGANGAHSDSKKVEEVTQDLKETSLEENKPEEQPEGETATA